MCEVIYKVAVRVGILLVLCMLCRQGHAETKLITETVRLIWILEQNLAIGRIGLCKRKREREVESETAGIGSSPLLSF